MSEKAGSLLAGFQKHIALLSLAQCLFTLAAFAHGVYTGLAGNLLAPSPSLATLPISIMILGTLVTVFPLSHFMQKYGRKYGFMLALLAGIASGGLGYLALVERSFPLLCLATFLHGVYQAGGQFYRFAAMELAPERYRSRAIAYVLAGGIVAPIIGPTLFSRINDMFEPLAFAGVYLSLIAIGLIALIVISAIPFTAPTQADGAGEPARPLREIMRQPVFITATTTATAGFAIMMLMMTGAPLAIVGCGFGVGIAASVIQWHILGMFLPSFISGPLIARVGTLPVMLFGSLLFIAAGVIAILGLEIGNFRYSLLLVAAGWNFLYTAGTHLLADSYRPSEKAKVQALNECLLFGFSAVTSLLAGVLLDQVGWWSVAAATIVAACGLVIVILRYSFYRRAPQAS